MPAYRFKNISDLAYTVAALQLAAQQYRQLAGDVGQPRIAEQFRHQAEVVERIAEDLDALEG